MRSTPDRRILVLLDGTLPGERALRWVRDLMRGSRSVLHLLMVVGPALPVRAGERVVAFGDQLEDDARRRSLVYLERVAAGFHEDGVAVETHVLTGRPLEVAASAAEALAADLLVLSVTDVPADILRFARLPTLVAGPGCLRSA